MKRFCRKSLQVCFFSHFETICSVGDSLAFFLEQYQQFVRFNEEYLSRAMKDGPHDYIS